MAIPYKIEGTSKTQSIAYKGEAAIVLVHPAFLLV